MFDVKSVSEVGTTPAFWCCYASVFYEFPLRLVVTVGIEFRIFGIPD
jgi:hypothetical protein